ncbi:MAG TPA: hypothetical protein EYG85_02420 [Crocinitomix sp.]|nr:hypothetical protein [Crocinitomix sp.]
MNIYLTYDYELYFGTPTGTVEKCIIEPTNLICKIAKKTGVKMVFFIDVGYLKKLETYRHQYKSVEKDYQLVVKQIKDLVTQGHDCQLHIHPHWEDCTHNGKRWQMKTNRYKLSDFKDNEIENIITEYKQILEQITQKPVIAYRAGGWCLQPFNRIKKAFTKAGLKIDSTVFIGGENTKAPYFYDFTNVPNKDKWHFSDDLCKEDKNGNFLEYPISSFFYSKWFFWRLFILGRLQPKLHKPIGNGYPIPSGSNKKQMLTKGKLHSASVDGYFAAKLKQVLKQNEKLGWTETVFIGHPKASTYFALKKLENFIVNHKTKVNFKTFSEI